MAQDRAVTVARTAETHAVFSAWPRKPLLVTQGFIALTAFAGGAALIVGSANPNFGVAIAELGFLLIGLGVLRPLVPRY